MPSVRGEIIRQVTDEYLATTKGQDPNTPPDVVQGDILEEIEKRIVAENAIRATGTKWQVPVKLSPFQIADIIAVRHPVALIPIAGRNSDREYCLLGLYQDTGDNMGLYDTSDEVIDELAESYCYEMTEFELKEMKRVLRRKAPCKTPTMEKNLIAVNNGIFDFDKKILLPFSSDYVFLSKCRVDYNVNAKNVVIHNPNDNTDWDVESWMQDLFDDSEIVDLMWKILGAIVRPNVPWGKSAWFYSESGNNGKGTLCELMRQLCGENSYAAISLADMGKDFMLEPLIRAVAVIVDENDVGTYIDKAANLKAIITGDGVQINRKFKTPIAFQFHGFMVQCLNEMPRIKDKSDSFYRRQLFIPFTKCFTGAERKYIKQDYLKRRDVLEYVLWKVLNMDYYELPIPKACQLALEEYKEFNDPLRQFVNEIFPELQWDLLPFQFLYDLYVSWYRKTVGNREVLGRQTFMKSLLLLVEQLPDWKCEDKTKSISSVGKMNRPEPLIDEYDLKDWMNPMYMSSADVSKKCIPLLKVNYRGIVRVSS